MSRDRANTHVDTVMIEAYAAQLLDAGAAASIERHLSYCDQCRANVAAAGTRGDLPGLGTDRLASIWAAVIDDIDPPPITVPRRKRHFLPKAGDRVQQLLARFAIPTARLVPWARLAVVTAVAAITIPAFNISGPGSFLAGDNIDSMVVDGTRDHAQTTLHNVSQRPPCPQTEVSFALTWGPGWLPWVVFTIRDGSATDRGCAADQQHSQCGMPTTAA